MTVKYFSFITPKEHDIAPFKSHPQFSIITDILARQYRHHALLHPEFSLTLLSPFLESFFQYLTQNEMPARLRQSEFIHLDIENIIYNHAHEKEIEKEFSYLYNTLECNENYCVFIITNTDLLNKKSKPINESFLKSQIESLLIHPKARFLLFSAKNTAFPLEAFHHEFVSVDLQSPDHADILSLLKVKRAHLEAFHQITIPDDLLATAFALAERFLSTTDTFEQTLLLLDSSAAHASIHREQEKDSNLQSILTLSTLLQVLSNWTNIPVSHLQIRKFHIGEFNQQMQQRVFGQDIAISMIGQELQQSQAHLQMKAGIFGSFLFIGPKHSGKKTAAIALTNQLFQQLNALYFIHSYTSANSLLDLSLQRCQDKKHFLLKEVIKKMPYAALFMEDIDQAPMHILDELQEILRTGSLYDEKGETVHFNQAMIILSMTQGSNLLSEITKSFSPEEENEEMDLMRLVMNEFKTSTQTMRPSTYDLSNELLPIASNYLPLDLCQKTALIPFLPLTKKSIENIIRLKLRVLGKQLNASYGIELGYAPEVIRYLIHQILLKPETDSDSIEIDKAIKQLYFVVEQAILSHGENKNRLNQLFLQLNETGQLLKCDWSLIPSERQHTT